MQRSIKISLKKIFEFFGYTINRNYPDKVFQFPKEFFPIEMNEIQKKIIRDSEKYSMTGRTRMSLLIKIIEYLTKHNIDGDIVECGVWKGGNLICAQAYLNHLNLKKNIIGYDTFEGMTAASEHDIQEFQVKSKDNNSSSILRKSVAKDMMNAIDKHTNEGKNIWAYCSIEDVKHHIKKNVPNNNIKLIKGPVEQTLLVEDSLPEKISLLRLDTDFYSSTKIELEILYPRLIKGGFLIIDDYGHWKGSRKAVDDFFNKKMPFVHFIDETCRLIIKD
jgi:O-methyltransferase